MSAFQQQTLPVWVETQVNAKPAWIEMLLNRPSTRLFYRVSKADYPLFPLPCEVEISFAPHGFQRVSAARGPRIWARVVNALEDQERIDDLLKIEQEFITRYGDCLAEQGGT